MNTLDKSLKPSFGKVFGLDGVVEVDSNLGGTEHPAPFAIKLEGSANGHRDNRNAEVVGHKKSTLLKRADLTVQSAAAFRKNDYTDTLLNVSAHALQSLLKLGRPSSRAHRDVPKTFHHPSIGRNLEVRIEFQSSDKLRNRRINHKGIEEIDMIANENAGALTVEARCVFHFKLNSGHAQDVAEKDALRPIVSAGVDEYAQKDQETADRKKVNDAYEPEEGTAND